jgi:hypothetical protein
MWQADTAMLKDVGAADWRPSLAVGDAVRVRAGTSDPDFPDRPLDGWIGKIVERNEKAVPTQCRVQWDESTLDAMSAGDRKRCEREDFVLDQMWLFEDDLDVLTD